VPKAIESCVAKMHGTNKRTGKPFTQSEKWAICTAAHKKSQGKASADVEITEEEFAIAAEHFDAKMNACHQRMMKTGRAKSMDEAHQLCQKMLAKASNDIHKMEFILDMEFINR